MKSVTFTRVIDGVPVLMKRCAACGVAKQVSADRDVSGFWMMAPATPTRAASYRSCCKECHRTDPELVRKRRAAARAYYWRKKQAEPAYFAEAARITYRLRREKAGLPLRGPQKNVLMTSRDDQPRLPPGPLVELIDRLAADAACGTTGVCEAIGISQRRLWGWRSGESGLAGFDAAEKVLLHAGLTWSDVWPTAEFPEIAERLGYADQLTASRRTG